MSEVDEISEFVKERDEALLSGDLDRVIAFHAKHNPSRGFSSREVAEIGMHKARTAILSFPREARVASARWLRERGYSTFDDGDLND